MILPNRIVRTILLGLFFLLVFSSNKGFAQNGQQLFSQNCASCHHPTKRLTGPALAGVETRGPWTDKKNLYAWVHNPSGFAKTDKSGYADGLIKEYGTLMTPFPSLSEADIDAIVEYVNKAAVPTDEGKKGDPNAASAEEGDSSLLFGILTLILAVVALILLQVNSNLKKLSDDREGVPAYEPVPFYRNKAYLALGIVVLFLVGGYYTVKGAVHLGRNKDYQPEQPIFFSHKVHAGANQINCQYCHNGVAEGKHANIPSLNVCMNCHMAINEYTGDKLFKEDGTEVNGTAEIQKIYKAVGFTPGKNANNWDMNAGAKGIAWARIHNLPDHVYFNHSQHVKAGKIQCQTCHGEIQKMDEVKQFSELSMGWCVNCHRETKVQFKENGFYSIYEKYHDEIKRGVRDSVTASDIGATDCQRCHY
jgi:mono/diheme cytochrome c family protein